MLKLFITVLLYFIAAWNIRKIKSHNLKVVVRICIVIIGALLLYAAYLSFRHDLLYSAEYIEQSMRYGFI
ncbi:MAG: hypothetical protein KKC75_00490 [Nanoarchaeota archaeon]|nr:hypothetical protein [Nanoarchaeota archaeon]MBU1005196.1 hypothetical protein [Nanoarchaeota archaeon]MBU1946867.1 hypothetical protein [Nanoarchaeota archaeon]